MYHTRRRRTRRSHRSRRRTYKGGVAIAAIEKIVSKIKTQNKANKEIARYEKQIQDTNAEINQPGNTTTDIKKFKARITYYNNVIRAIMLKFQGQVMDLSLSDDFSVHSPVESIASDFSFSSRSHKRHKHPYDAEELNMALFDE